LHDRCLPHELTRRGRVLLATLHNRASHLRVAARGCVNLANSADAQNRRNKRDMTHRLRLGRACRAHPPRASQHLTSSLSSFHKYRRSLWFAHRRGRRHARLHFTLLDGVLFLFHAALGGGIDNARRASCLSNAFCKGHLYTRAPAINAGRGLLHASYINVPPFTTHLHHRAVVGILILPHAPGCLAHSDCGNWCAALAARTSSGISPFLHACVARLHCALAPRRTDTHTREGGEPLATAC